VVYLPLHQRKIISYSLDVLRAATARSSDTRIDKIEVKLALRCLLPHCPEKWPLLLFWDAACQPNEIGRAQGVTAAFNGIVRQLRRSGCYEEVTPSGRAALIANDRSDSNTS
jgi:hypothetical protein